MGRAILSYVSQAMTVCCLVAAPAAVGAARTVTDLSSVRGFNYTPATAQGHLGFWQKYDAETVERDLGFAVRLNLNQARVFVPFDAWAENKEGFREHLSAFVRACNEHHIGVMPVLAPGDRMIDEMPEEQSRALLSSWIEDLVRAIGSEPGLAFWDVANEPDWRGYPDHRRSAESIRRRMDLARWMSEKMHALDKNTPVTVGCTHVPCMEELAGSVDVLSYHDYSPTAHEIHANISAAEAAAARMKKPVFNTEIGCIGRANPYDIALQEYRSANMGWYIWELMITHFWGDVHGVYYADGTVRDPSIAAAVLGIFRNRSATVVPENPDREGWVTRSVNDGKKWLNDPAPDWNRGLDLAETQANLIEAAQLTGMRELPTRAVDVLRAGVPDMKALHSLIGRFIAILEPYEKK
jgi:hypothetical protein